jgi:hypothetical protein
VKPAILFGPEDRFLNWIAEATNRLPFTPLVNNGDTIVQPVYSADVGKGLFNIVLVSGTQIYTTMINLTSYMVLLRLLGA